MKLTLSQAEADKNYSPCAWEWEFLALLLQKLTNEGGRHTVRPLVIVIA